MAKISKFGSEKLILSETGKPMFRRCENADCSVTKDFTPEEKGFVKTLEIKVILRREGFSERTFTNRVAYFVQTFKCRMPKDRELEFSYFYYEPKAMDNVCVRDFNNDKTTTINVMNPETAKYYGIKAVGKPKRVSENKARHMILNKEVLPQVFDDSGETGTTISY